MIKRAVGAWLAAVLLAGAGIAGEPEGGEAKLTPGQGRALWERAAAGDAVYSDFAQPEKGRAFDLGKSAAPALKEKVKALKVDAPCAMSPGKSKLGDDTVTIENGVVKLVIVPAYGGRIIEISNRATGANIFTDNYRNAETKPEMEGKKKDKAPNLLGGWIEGVDDGNQSYWNTPHAVKAAKSTADEIVVQTAGEVKNSTWGVEGAVTVERTIAIRKGSGLVRMHIKLTNHSGDKEREFRFRPHARHALGGRAEGDEFWLSTLGYVREIPPDHDGDCFSVVRAETKLDTWQGILDRAAREGAVVLPGGEINDVMCIYGTEKGEKHWYTYENTSTLREHVVEGRTIEVDHDYAPILNFDAVTFANRDIAVEFLPEKVHFAPGEKVKALAGAAALAADKAGKVQFTPTFVRHGKVVAKCKPIEGDAALLVAEPKVVEFPVPPDLADGPCDLVVEISAGGAAMGVSRFPAFVSDGAGAFLSLLRPSDDGCGKGLSVTGDLERAQVAVEKSGAGETSGAYKLNDASLPWRTRISPAAGGAFLIEHTVDLSKFPAGALLSSLGMSFPYRMGTDLSRIEVGGAQRLRQPYQKVLRVTVGSSARDDQWFVDQARGGREQEYQRPIPSYFLSDNADRFPVWRFGGILQRDSTTAWIYKNANYDVPPVPVVQEESAIGWVDAYSLLTKQGVLVYMPDMAVAAPKEVCFDGERGAFLVYFFPPHVPAMSLAKAGKQGKSRAELWGFGADGKATFRFYVLFHAKDLTGHLPYKGNVASEIREIVKGLGK